MIAVGKVTVGKVTVRVMMEERVGVGAKKVGEGEEGGGGDEEWLG